MEIFFLILPLTISLLVQPIRGSVEDELSKDPVDENVFDQIQLINGDNDHFEGDIVMSTEDVVKLLSQRERKRREIVSSTWLIWPNGVVPYTFRNGFPYEKQVKEAMREVERLTCIRFVPRTTQRGYVEFIRGSGCYSEIGYKRRRQRISIGSGCQTKGVIIHEILHALGFYHEQSRLDRDQYLHINWDNIATRNKRNFQKYDRGVAESFGEKYDKGSVMQYGNYAFAINRRLMTIVSKSDAKERLGQRRGMSSSDIRQLNMRYGCGDVTPPPTTTTTVDPSCVDKQRYCKRSDIQYYCIRNSMIRNGCQRTCNNCPQKPTTTTSTTTTTPTTTSTTPATTTTTPKTTTTAPTTTTTTTTSTTTMRTTNTPSKLTTPTTTTTKSKCRDLLYWCDANWVRSTCQTSQSLRRICPKTCGICSGPPTTTATTTPKPACRDKFSYCRRPSVIYACPRFLNIRQNCPKSCNVCPKTTTTTPEPTTTQPKITTSPLRTQETTMATTTTKLPTTMTTTTTKLPTTMTTTTTKLPTTSTTTSTKLPRTQPTTTDSQSTNSPTISTTNEKTTKNKSTTPTTNPSTSGDKSTTTPKTSTACEDKMSCCEELALGGLCKNRLVETKCIKSCGKCNNSNDV
eukprot:TCONS_00018805-protein